MIVEEQPPNQANYKESQLTNPYFAPKEIVTAQELTAKRSRSSSMRPGILKKTKSPPHRRSV